MRATEREVSFARGEVVADSRATTQCIERGLKSGGPLNPANVRTTDSPKPTVGIGLRALPQTAELLAKSGNAAEGVRCRLQFLDALKFSPFSSVSATCSRPRIAVRRPRRGDYPKHNASPYLRSKGRSHVSFENVARLETNVEQT